MTAAIDAARVFRSGGARPEFDRAVQAILATNVVQGDSLNAAEKIVFVEYIPVERERFERIPSELEAPEMDLFYEPPAPLLTIHFTELGA